MDRRSPEDCVNWKAQIVKVSMLLGTLVWKDILSFTLAMDGRQESCGAAASASSASVFGVVRFFFSQPLN